MAATTIRAKHIKANSAKTPPIIPGNVDDEAPVLWRNYSSGSIWGHCIVTTLIHFILTPCMRTSAFIG